MDTIINRIKREKYYIDSQRCFLIFVAVFCLYSPLFAQSDVPQDAAPPPLKFVSKAEKTQLNAETNVKKYTIRALELMDARLASAENLTTQRQFEQMFNELGDFQALVDGTLVYLNKHDDDSGKVLNNFKRLEISLRKYSPRLEMIRREVPGRYEPYLRSLIVDLRDARTKAVEPLFSNSILPDDNNKKPL